MRSSQIQILDAWITVEQLSEGDIEKVILSIRFFKGMTINRY